jgi:DNA end-binding protein Ku
MPRAIWKGAITFGLVHVPVALHPAAQENDVDFDWLDKRSMDPVGYKRINKRTGREIDKENIVKGVKQESGEYVVLSDQEVAEAYPRSTQTIEIETFVAASDISFVHFERPYFLAPIGQGEKVYVLLREAMLQAGVVGIARLVLHTKEHLAALIPTKPAVMLNTLRWATEIRPVDQLDIPAAGKSALKLKESELEMAGRLIEDMTTKWDPGDYADKFTGAIHELVARKVKAGKTAKVEPLEEAPASSSNVVDLMALLKRSLDPHKQGDRNASRKTMATRPAAKRVARKRA